MESTVHHITITVHIMNIKIAKITPIYKTGQKNMFNNYIDPWIRSSPAFSKIYWKKSCTIVYLHFCEKHSILYKYQFDFRKHHSTVHPIIHLLHYNIADTKDQPTQLKD